MRRFVVEVVIDAIILFAVLLLLSIITVPQPFPFGTQRVPIFTIDAAGIRSDRHVRTGDRHRRDIANRLACWSVEMSASVDSAPWFSLRPCACNPSQQPPVATSYKLTLLSLAPKNQPAHRSTARAQVGSAVSA